MTKPCSSPTWRSREGDAVWQNREQIITPNYRHSSLSAPQQIRVYLSFQLTPWIGSAFCIKQITNLREGLLAGNLLVKHFLQK